MLLDVKNLLLEKGLNLISVVITAAAEFCIIKAEFVRSQVYYEVVKQSCSHCIRSRLFC